MPFRALGEEPVYDGHVISVARGRFADPDGGEFDRDVVHHPGAVSVVPLLDGPRGPVAVLLCQYRAAIDAEILEIPAGKRDVEGEAADVTARRELAEEVGYAAGSLELLGEFYNSPGFSDERSFTYLARDLTASEASPQGVEEEHMTVVEVPLAEVPSLIAEARLTDAKSIIALLLTLRRLEGEPMGESVARAAGQP